MEEKKNHTANNSTEAITDGKGIETAFQLSEERWMVAAG